VRRIRLGKCSRARSGTQAVPEVYAMIREALREMCEERPDARNFFGGYTVARTSLTFAH
jgi:hypothetical protein